MRTKRYSKKKRGRKRLEMRRSEQGCEHLEERQLLTVAPVNVDALPNGVTVFTDTPTVITARFSDADGVDDMRISDIQVFNGEANAPRCFVRYDEVTNEFQLWNDPTLSFLPAGSPGDNTVTSNSVCSFDASSSGTTDIDANTLQVDLSITLSTDFQGPDSVWTRVTDYSGLVSDVAVMASITVEDPPTDPDPPPVAETSVAMYFEDRDAAMALNFDTELLTCGMIHSNLGRIPTTAIARAQETRDAWPGVMDDGELYDIPLGFNICALEAVYDDLGPAAEYPELDVTHDWHPESYWADNTWYSDAPPNGGSYTTVGPLLGGTHSYDIVYGGDLTERALNSTTDFEIAYHNFGHESYKFTTTEQLENTFIRGVEYHERVGVRPTALAAPWNQNPSADRYQIMVDNGFFTFNRRENADGVPYEVVEDLWVVPRSGSFDSDTDMTAWIDQVIQDGTVLAKGSHQEDGFDVDRTGFQQSLAYARTKVDSGELWATTLAEIGRYSEAKSDVSIESEIVGDKTIVDITLTDYDASKFGIPYLTFTSTMPDASPHASVEVNFPTTQTLNSSDGPTDFSRTRVENGEVTYSIFLNPTGTTRVEIDGVAAAVTGGVDINDPVLSIDSTAPVDPEEGEFVTIQATAQATDDIYTANIIYNINGGATQSAILTNTGSQWETDLGPYDAGDTVSYYVTVTDNSGDRVRSADKSFNVVEVDDPDPGTGYPEYSQPGIDLTGLTGTFNLHWTDDTGLDGYQFSIDTGGGFETQPYVEFSPGSGEPTTSWWDSDWDYRRTLSVDNSASATALTDQAVLVTVDTATLVGAGKMNEHGGDVRFVDSADNELEFWVESGMNSAQTRFWVKIPNVAASGITEFDMYYGNENRTVPQGEGVDTFPLFDDFGGAGWEIYKYDQNPIKGPTHPAGQGAFSSVIREDDGTWKMYSSYDLQGNNIAVSTSDDGINWVRYGIALERGSQFGGLNAEWDAKNIWAPVVWKEEGTYYMLYPGKGPLVDGPIRTGLATSDDGFIWTKYDDPSTTAHPFAESDPVFNHPNTAAGDPGWATDDTEGGCFSVVKEGDTYYQMYNTLRSHRRASVASSTDLINWTPVYGDEPRFVSTQTSDWNYNMFCGHAFEFEDQYYLLMTGQDVTRDYGKFGLFVSDSPEFPEETTEFKGIAMIGAREGWDATDMDTPWIVPTEGNSAHMYYEACGVCHTETGVALIDDLGWALSQTYQPGNYYDIDRDASPSLRVMPPVGWEKSIDGFEEVDNQNFEIVIDEAMTGRAVALKDFNAGKSMYMQKDVDAQEEGVVSAWLKTDSISASGDHDLYIYGDSTQNLAMVGGLGRGGEFHYWDGSFASTGVSYQADTWYRVEFHFDVTTDTYDFVVWDTAFNELVRVENISFGQAVNSGGIDRVKVRPSSGFDGTGYVDDVVVRSGQDMTAAVGSETVEGNGPTTAAWASAEADLPFKLGAIFSWKYDVTDVDGNVTQSEVYEMPFGSSLGPFQIGGGTAGTTPLVAGITIPSDDPTDPADSEDEAVSVPDLTGSSTISGGVTEGVEAAAAIGAWEPETDNAETTEEEAPSEETFVVRTFVPTAETAAAQAADDSSSDVTSPVTLPIGRRVRTRPATSSTNDNTALAAAVDSVFAEDEASS